ncbi:MAG: response regulator [Ekhidna sp.]|nr:response regulator [Ekhidna sp.]
MLDESVASFNVPDEIEEDFNNILYVDDENSNLRVFDSVFSRYYNVFTANNGKTAIKLLREYDINMIITDQKMPEMTGTDLLEQTLEEFPDMIRIILTGFADIQAIIKAINKCSIYKYVTKPYENAEMREIIDKGLEIFNMREKKYQGSPFFAKKNGNVNGSSNGASEDGSGEVNHNFATKVLGDIITKKENYELYLENAISYNFQKEKPLFFKDFYIHAGEESAKLYHVSYKVDQPDKAAIVYMHLKLKLRQILIKNDNNIGLHELIEQLEQFYIELDEEVKISNWNILTYDWDAGKLECVTKELESRVYTIGHQLEEVKFELANNLLEGYKHYTIDSDMSLMVYGWDFEANSSDGESDISHNVNMIVNNATSYPLDMQENQITKGLESLSKNYKDLIFYGLHITEENEN